MGKKRFSIELQTTVIIELDDAVIDAVTDEWRSCFYHLLDDIAIAEHIACNLVARRQKLSQLDGWADQPDCNAHIVELLGWEVEAEVIE